MNTFFGVFEPFFAESSAAFLAFFRFCSVSLSEDIEMT